MNSLNSVQLIGNVTRDPEIRALSSGTKVARFSIACNESWKDKATNEKRERTEFVRCVAFSDGLVGVIERYVKKGSRIYFQGQIQTRKFQDQQGNDKYVTEVVAQGFNGKLLMLDGKPTGTKTEQDGFGGSSGGGFDGDLDDSVPF